MNSNPPHNPWLHRLAVLTAATALLPIVMGAVVTTMGAGMAFPDWPSSDGQNMFLYPWLQSAGAKFVEHGHRLAGALIGVVSIALFVCAWWTKTRGSVRCLATLVLLAVVAQGILGGQRVLLNDPRLAMLHGIFAAGVFCLMAALATISGRWWNETAPSSRLKNPGMLRALALMTPVFLLGQYVLGGYVRHLGTALHEHLGFAAVAFLVVAATSTAAFRREANGLRAPAAFLCGLLLIQISLGAAAWATKFGFPPLGYVAMPQSALQTVVRSSHTVVGMLLLMTAVVLTMRVFRVTSGATFASVSPALPVSAVSSISAEGGAR